jgi:hypothetical protein
MTTSAAFDGLVLKMKKLRVVQSVELRFNKFSVSAGMEEERVKDEREKGDVCERI